MMSLVLETPMGRGAKTISPSLAGDFDRAGAVDNASWLLNVRLPWELERTCQIPTYNRDGRFGLVTGF
jgi:hypothetical protein